MKTHLITVDSGTTNTRAAVWTRDGKCLAVEKDEVGVRNTAIDGNNSRLATAVKSCIERALATAGVGFDSVAAVYASGMITSNVGLVEVPHLIGPVGMKDFVAGVTEVDLPGVSPMPIHFVPGLKNMAGTIAPADVEAMDIMRGEETETLALLSWVPAGKKYLFVLPGSHTKFVAVDDEGRLVGCLTSLAGELLSLLTTQSILADAVERRFVTEGDYDREAVLAGFRVARATSLSRAAFSTRIMKLFVDSNPAACANFLLGAVLESDVAAVKGSKALKLSGDADVIIAGKEPLRSALADVFGEDGMFGGVRSFTPPDGVFLAGYGAYLVAKERGAFGAV